MIYFELGNVSFLRRSLKTIFYQLNVIFEIVENYLACVDEQIAQIAPADAPMEYYDSPEYQSQFDGFKALTDMAESTRDIAVERYNYLLTITH